MQTVRIRNILFLVGEGKCIPKKKQSNGAWRLVDMPDIRPHLRNLQGRTAILIIFSLRKKATNGKNYADQIAKWKL